MKEDVAMNDQRRAALAIHALPELDRAWLLHQLPEHQRLLLLPLLDELRDIGIPPEPAMLDAIRPAAGTGPAVREEEPGVLEMLLAAEPLRLTGLVLAMRDWPVGACFAARVPPGRAAEALSLVSCDEPAPALRHALVRAVHEALEHKPPSPRDGAVPPWRRLLGVWRRRAG